MKRSELIKEIQEYLEYQEYHEYSAYAGSVLELVEKYMKPNNHTHPRAIKEFGDVIKEKGDHWGYIHYIDKYPEHYFLKGRPYEFYMQGWEDEDET